MTEAEWLACAEPTLLLEFLRGKASERRLRLFACACCRHIAHLFFSREQHRAVETAEKFADDLTRDTNLAELYSTLDGLRPLAPENENSVRHQTAQFSYHAVINAISTSARYNDIGAGSYDLWENVKEVADSCARALAWAGKARPDFLAAIAMQSVLARDIFGNPFRPLPFDPAWRTTTVVSLATAIYEERAFNRLPILSDALEDAGCTHADILNHCREPGEHARGCWLLDLILGRQ